MAPKSYDVLQAISQMGVLTSSELMSKADRLLRSARSETGVPDDVGRWLTLVALVSDTIREFPEGTERDEVERWLLIQWKQPEYVEP